MENTLFSVLTVSCPAVEEAIAFCPSVDVLRRLEEEVVSAAAVATAAAAEDLASSSSEVNLETFHGLR